MHDKGPEKGQRARHRQGPGPQPPPPAPSVVLSPCPPRPRYAPSTAPTDVRPESRVSSLQVRDLERREKRTQALVALRVRSAASRPCVFGVEHLGGEVPVCE